MDIKTINKKNNKNNVKFVKSIAICTFMFAHR